ncbi:MAG: tyrosine-type recombinase/integrase [Candidatus Dependentiae bacterium]|jgi:integrase/recombinase XerC/integrase/recombinase XerD|nr:tyrosine-type recombinase/integrase [Candidatus Dependentiae bacterium]
MKSTKQLVVVAAEPGWLRGGDGLIEQFIADQDVALSSRRTYRQSLTQFFGWLAREQDSAAPTRETILRYKEVLDARQLRPLTRSSYLVAVRKFFEWAEGRKYYPNIAKGVKGLRRSTKTHQRSALTLDQIGALLSAIERDSLRGIRDYALINLLCRTGLRLIEVARAQLEDLEQRADGKAVLWVRGKGREGKDEFVVITDEVMGPISCYLRERRPQALSAPLFASLSDRNLGKKLTTYSLSRIVKQRLRAIGIDTRRLSAHSLRHTFGVMAIRAGASLYEVQLAMRHTSPATTEIYLGDIEQAKRLEGGPEQRIADLLKKLGGSGS